MTQAAELARSPETTNPLESVKDIKTGVQIIQHVLREVMKKGVHYDTIPGCGDKPALLKPGAEKILSTFRIAADPHIEEIPSAGEIRYRVKVEGKTPAGLTVGFGIGECSTEEEKYKWRRAICDEEFNETMEDRRRAAWKKGKDGPYQIKQVRIQPADIANTVLKMAKKRALVDLCLTATAASDCFSQDLDEMELETAEAVTGQDQRTVQTPQRKPAAEQPKGDGLDFAGEFPELPKQPDVSKCQVATGVLADVEQKDGTGDKGPWSKFGCKIGNAYYSTFDKKIGAAAFDMVGTPVRVFYNPSGKYKNLVWIEVENASA